MEQHATFSEAIIAIAQAAKEVTHENTRHVLIHLTAQFAEIELGKPNAVQNAIATCDSAETEKDDRPETDDAILMQALQTARSHLNYLSQ